MRERRVPRFLSDHAVLAFTLLGSTIWALGIGPGDYLPPLWQVLSIVAMLMAWPVFLVALLLRAIAFPTPYWFVVSLIAGCLIGAVIDAARRRRRQNPEAHDQAP